MSPIQSLYHVASRLRLDDNFSLSRSALYASLLTTHPDRTFPKHPPATHVHAAPPAPATPPPVPDHASLASALLSVQDAPSPEQDETLFQMRHFGSTASCIDSFTHVGFARACVISSSARLLAVAASRSHTKPECIVSILRFPSRASSPRSLCVPVQCGGVSALALSEGGDLAIASATGVSLNRICDDATVAPTGVLHGPSACDTLVVKNDPMHNHGLLTLTEHGQLHRWDTRASTAKPATTVHACRPLCDNTRADLVIGSVSAHVYVSSDSTPHLAAWDLRMPVADASPHRSFHGMPDAHAHWLYCSPMRSVLDVQEGASGGLLAAAGPDRVVRLWDCWHGGAALRELPMADAASRVQFAGWDTPSYGAKPGLWVETEGALHVVQVDSPYANV